MERVVRYCTCSEEEREHHFMEYLHSLRVHHSREGPINSTVNENAAVFQDLSGAANEHSLHQLYWLQDYNNNTHQ